MKWFQSSMERSIISLVVNNVTIIKVWSDKGFIYLSNDFLGKKFWNLRSKPMVLFIWLTIVLRCSSKFSLKSKYIPKNRTHFFNDVRFNVHQKRQIYRIQEHWSSNRLARVVPHGKTLKTPISFPRKHEE